MGGIKKQSVAKLFKVLQNYAIANNLPTNVEIPNDRSVIFKHLRDKKIYLGSIDIKSNNSENINKIIAEILRNLPKDIASSSTQSESPSEREANNKDSKKAATELPYSKKAYEEMSANERVLYKKSIQDEIEKSNKHLAELDLKESTNTKAIAGVKQKRLNRTTALDNTPNTDYDALVAEEILNQRNLADIAAQDAQARNTIIEPDQLPEVNVVNDANTPPITIIEPMIIPMDNNRTRVASTNTPTRLPIPDFNTFGQPGTLQMDTLKMNKSRIQKIGDDIETIKNIDLLTPEGQIYMKKKFLEQKQIFDWIASVTPQIPIATYKAVEQDQVSHNSDKYLVSVNQERWLRYSNSIPKNQKLYPA